MNRKAEFPILSAELNVKMEMQSGQHRIKILQELRSDSKHHWWKVIVYNERKALWLSSLTRFQNWHVLLEISFQVLETERDIWRQLTKVETEAALSTQPTQKHQLELHKKLLRLNLGQQSKSMYELPKYRGIVLKILQFPGLHHQFRAQGLEIFLRGRTIEVFQPSSIWIYG